MKAEIKKFLYSEKKVRDGKETIKHVALVEDELGNLLECVIYIGGAVEVFYHNGQARAFVKKTAQPKVNKRVD